MRVLLIISVLLSIISIVYCQNSAVNGNNKAAVQAQLSQHNQLTDCQTVYQNNLYDLTNYRHPAGNALIKPCCGSTVCDGVAAAFHANQVGRLVQKLAKFKIPAPAADQVNDAPVTINPQSTQQSTSPVNSDGSNNGSNSVALTGVKGYIALVCVLSVLCGFFAGVSIMLMYQRRKAN